MRVPLPGTVASDIVVRFTYDDRIVEARQSDTIASALINAGETRFRVDRGGHARAPFCGMGACFECLVTVDGQAQRACLERATDGVRVRPYREAEASPHEENSRSEVHSADLLIVGGGPAGLSAAAYAAEAGLQVLLLEERAQLGGQYYKQPASSIVADAVRLDRQFRAGRELIARVERSGARILSGTSVWGTLSAQEILASAGDRQVRIRCKHLILAPGAYERGVPFPGWTLPGVMTTGAVQTFLRSAATLPGQRVLIAGNGPLNLQLAHELLQAGAKVVALAELATRPGVAALGHLARMIALAPDLVRDGVMYRLSALRGSVPVLHGHAIGGVEGEGRAEVAWVAPLDARGRPDPSRARRFEVDCVCLGYGFLPSVDLARLLGCRLADDPRWKAMRVVTDDQGCTSVPGVYAIGDGARFGGARAALIQGRLAAAAVARECGVAVADEGTLDYDQRALGRQRRFQTALWTLYDAPVLTDALCHADTLICRCESVDLQQIEGVLRSGVQSLGALKRETRLGMGRCQGRYCTPVAADLLARQRGSPLGPDDLLAPQAPVRPVTIGAVAGLDLQPEGEGP
jgi:NADPH-dependent 2,4-dienoyl-CoA reductase/sulfur reductase-like enzyme